MRQRRRSGSGFSLVEMTIGVAVLFVLGAGLTLSMTSLRRLTQASSTDAKLQDEASRALAAITRDLRRSGFVVPDGVHAFPYVFADGDATGDFSEHAHAPASHAAQAGDADFGPTREIVFLLPQDLDDDGDPDTGLLPDGRPDLDASGDLVWSVDEISFVLVTGADGVNVLERRVNAADGRSVARNVERVTFDTSAEDPVLVPFGAVRVRLWLRQLDERGALHRHVVEQTVRLRNG
ncbi:MAG: hypothetical protein IPJ77_09825 [Planctomycetes bacterium]|nr:hypothetical protein [Planctomycetota bacterium]